jgi:glucose/arabinose dehydrogenase
VIRFAPVRVAAQAAPVWLVALTAVGACALAPGAQAAASLGDGEGGIRYSPVASFTQPTHLARAPGRVNRGLLFVTEKGGRVMVVRQGTPLAQPFLDISRRVQAADFEQGLLSIAFHPRYARNGVFYVYFTGNDAEVEIFEFRRSRRSRLRARRSSGRRLLSIPHPDGVPDHNGGQLAFGPDGLLYAGTGDGFETPRAAQRRSSLHGKLLRIRPLPGVRATARRRPYEIPPGNPFVGKPGRDEIYALGLRNPFRFSFDSLTGAISIADVGESAREEIDFRARGRARGANFGWPRWEGTILHDPEVGAPGAVFPAHEYPHDGRCAVIGGFVVRDPRLTHQYGRYLYTDLCDGLLRSQIPGEAGAGNDREVGGVPPLSLPQSFGEGAKHRIFICTADAIYRLDPA